MGLGHLPQLLLQILDFVAQTSRELELQLLRSRVHLVVQLTNQVGKILCRQTGLKNLLMPLVCLLLVVEGHTQV